MTKHCLSAAPSNSYLISRKRAGGLYSKSALRSFDEELEAYELLDLDAPGEPDDELVDVDDITRDILIG